MVIKVGSSTVVGNYFSTPYLDNITDTTASVYGVSTNDPFQGIFATNTISGTSFVAFDHSMGESNRNGQRIDMSNNMTLYYEASSASAGFVSNLLIDRNPSGTAHTLDFSSSEPGAMNIRWEDDTEPSWNDWQYWHVFGICLDSSNIRVSAIPWNQTSTAVPPGSFTGREEASGVLAYISAFDENTQGGLASDQSKGTFRIERTATGHRIQVRYDLGDIANWYNSAGQSQSLTSSWSTIYTSTTTPTAVKITSTSSLGSLDSGWITTGSSGVGVNQSFDASASVGGVGTDNQTDNRYFDFWVRASGYADTKVAEFSGTAIASAVSECFIGDSLLTMVDSDGSNMQNVSMEQAYNTYQADTSIARYVQGNDNVVNQIIEFRKTDGFTTLISFNGSDFFVTGGHPFLTTDGWKCVHLAAGQAINPNLNLTQLEVGDTLVKFNPSTQQYYQEELTSIESNHQAISVYSLDVSGPDSGSTGNDTYVVDQFVVHNK